MIAGIDAIGKIQKEKNCIYLCQNVQDGCRPNNRLGFKFGWSIDEGSRDDIMRNDVRYLRIFDDKDLTPIILKLINEFENEQVLNQKREKRKVRKK